MRTRAEVWPEALGVSALSVGLAVLMSWPQVRGLSTTVPRDMGDSLDFAYQQAWIGHALTADPGHLFTTNVFLGAKDNLAFTDMVLGYAPLALLARLFGSGQATALAALNLGLLFSTAMAFGGAYALARALGARWPGALVAGAGFGFAPWRLEQIVHVNIEATGGMALSLALLAWGHGWTLRHGWRPETARPGLAFAGWLVACWQLSLGFAIGLPFVYAIGIVMLLWVLGWLLTGRRPLPRRLALADAAGWVAFGVSGLLLTRPLFWVTAHYPEARRTMFDVSWLSAPWRGYFIAPETDRWWGTGTATWRQALGWQQEMVLLPGFALMGLALLGLFVSSWTLRRRLGMLAATAVVLVLSLGTTFFGGHWTYELLYRYAPGWNALRVSGRLVIWVTLGLCLLAAGAVSEIADAVLAPQLQPATGDVPAGAGESAPVDEASGEPGSGGRTAGAAASGSDGRTSRRLADGEDPARTGVPGGSGVSGDSRVLGGSGESGPAAAPGGWGRPAGFPSGRPGRAGRSGRWSVAAALTAAFLAVPAAVVVMEGRGDVPVWTVASAPVPLRSLPQPILVLPTSMIGDYHIMVWSADGFPLLANGGSGFVPKFQDVLVQDANTFPDPVSIAALRRRGIATVVIVRSRSAGTPFAASVDRPVTGLGIGRTDLGDAVIYDLR